MNRETGPSGSSGGTVVPSPSPLRQSESVSALSNWGVVDSASVSAVESGSSAASWAVCGRH